MASDTGTLNRCHYQGNNRTNPPTIKPLLSRKAHEEPTDLVKVVVDDDDCKILHLKCCLIGLLCGIAAQTISFAACMVYATMWGGNNTNPPISTISCVYRAVFSAFLVVMTYLEVILVVVVWVTFALLHFQSKTINSFMRKKKMSYRDNATSSSRICWSADHMFVMTCYIYGGIICGSWLITLSADVAMGRPLPVLPLFFEGATSLALLSDACLREVPDDDTPPDDELEETAADHYEYSKIEEV